MTLERSSLFILLDSAQVLGSDYLLLCYGIGIATMLVCGKLKTESQSENDER